MYDDVNPDLVYAVEKIYKPNGFIISDFIKEPESEKYSACRFKINGLKIVFRTAYVTPKKIGQFVTLWKRKGNGPILPFDLSDAVDFFVISVRNDQKLGQFIFSKKNLAEKNIISQSGKGGKRAMRVYCPWDKTKSPQAKKTQSWQLEYFIDISPHLSLKDKKINLPFLA